jgi:hypothetical protein
VKKVPHPFQSFYDTICFFSDDEELLFKISALGGFEESPV